MREAVRAVIAAVAAGASSWDCAVVVPHGDDVERAAAALEAAGLPVACRRPDRSTGPRLLRRLVDCLAPPAGRPFARRAVVDLLSAAPLLDAVASPREIALWLDEARQAGVVSGLEQWQERIGRRRRGLERRVVDLEAQARRSRRRRQRCRGEARRRDAAPRRGARPGGRRRRAALVLAAASRRAPRWGAWADALGGVAEALFEASAAAAAARRRRPPAALDVLDEEVDARRDGGGAARAARRRARAGGQSRSRRRRRPHAARDARSALPHRRVLRSGRRRFPRRAAGPIPILGDAGRRRLAEAFATRLPLAESRDAESTLLFAFACEAARERLTLLAPRSDAATGRPRLPSRLLLRLASLAAGHPVGLDEFLSGAPLAAVWRHVGSAPASADGGARVPGGRPHSVDRRS